MAKESFGVIDDDRTYTHAQLASILGRSDRLMKEWIREHVSFCEFGNGLLLVSGRRFRVAVERLSDMRENGGDEE